MNSLLSLEMAVIQNKLPLQPELPKEVTRLLNQYLNPFSQQAINKTLKASTPYSGYIRTKIHEAQLPQELFYIAFIESEFKPRAVSRSGAYGIWQFMRNSIGGYDISISEWADERFDFFKSTDAALHKLEYNFKQTGNWSLAMAAYNCGLGRVKRTVKSSGSHDFWVLARRHLLPSQTIHYVPKCFAIAYACSNKRDYNLTIHWEPTSQWNSIVLKKPVDISLLAKKANVPYSVLKTANAELNYRVTPPDKDYRLKFPSQYTQQIQEALNDDDSQFLNYYIYKIQEGDTLYALSAHYGISIEILKQFNPNLKPKALQIGQKLMIPAFKDVKPPKPNSQKKRNSIPPNSKGTYIVKSGDTLWDIAKRYNVTVDELKDFNKMKNNDILKIGTVIKVP